jgi:hypothetical protein
MATGIDAIAQQQQYQQQQLIQQQQMIKEYRWYNSYSIPYELQCGIVRLDLPEAMRIGSEKLPEDLTVTAYIVCNQLAME